MVYTRSGLSTNTSIQKQSSLDNIDTLYTVSLMSALYKDEHVSTLYKKFMKMSQQSKNRFLKELKEQYDLLQLAKIIF
jgi:hypothetical protein